MVLAAGLAVVGGQGILVSGGQSTNVKSDTLIQAIYLFFSLPRSREPPRKDHYTPVIRPTGGKLSGYVQSRRWRLVSETWLSPFFNMIVDSANILDRPPLSRNALFYRVNGHGWSEDC